MTLASKLRWGPDDPRLAGHTAFAFKYNPAGCRIYKSSSPGTRIFASDGDIQIEETSSSGGAVARYSQTQNIDEQSDGSYGD